MPWNDRVPVRIKEPSTKFHGHIDDEDLDQLFHLQNPQIRRAVKDFIGEEILSLQAKIILFPYQILSSFLSNALDLLQSIPLLEIVFFKLVRQNVLEPATFHEALANYNLWQGSALLGGLFLQHCIQSSHAYMVLYDRIKHALERQHFRHVKNGLQQFGRQLDKHIVHRVRIKVGALLVILELENADPRLAISQPEERGWTTERVPDLNAPVHDGASRWTNSFSQPEVAEEWENIASTPSREVRSQQPTKVNIWEVIRRPQEEAELVRWEDDTSTFNAPENQILGDSTMEE